ncbi:MAG: hypothetical protein ABID61_02715 [Candidatus Micrarchaeota archaeon]
MRKENFIIGLAWEDEDRWGIQHFKVAAENLDGAKNIAAMVVASGLYSFFYEITYVLSKDTAYIFSGGHFGPLFKKRKQIEITEQEAEEYRNLIKKLKEDQNSTAKKLIEKLGCKLFDKKIYIGPVLEEKDDI